MLRLFTKLPVSDERRLWVDRGIERLRLLLGGERLLRVEVVLPEDQFFPEKYDGSRASVLAMAARVASYMGVECDSFVVEIYAENEEAWRESVPLGSHDVEDAAGLYFHEPEDGRHLVGVHANQLDDPLSLVATLAHELAHVLLLGGGLQSRDDEDMEPMTDLATVLLGMGFFTASAAFQFKQWTSDSRQGWSTRRTGYLSEQTWGYALARFAEIRGEIDPRWAKALPKNVWTYFDQSSKWLRKQVRDR